MRAWRTLLEVWLVLGGTLATSACASHPSGASRASRASAEPSPPDCRSDLRRDARSLEEVADSAGLSAQIAANWMPGTGRTVASLHYDSLGGLDTAHIWSAFLPDSAGMHLTRALVAHFHLDGIPDHRVDLFLGDEAGPRVRRVARLQMCGPKWVDRGRVLERLSRESRALGIRAITRVTVYAFVHHDGTVEETRIKRTSGDPAVDQAALRIVQEAAEFTPGRIEGFPVSMWVSFPLTFVPRK